MIIKSNEAEVEWKGIYQSLVSEDTYQNILNEIPEGQIFEEESNSDDWTVSVHRGENDIKVEGNTLKRYGSPESSLFDWDIVYLTQQAIERQLAERGLHTLHAGAIEKDGSSVIFAGPSMTGKSVLTAYGVRNGYNFAGGEKVVIDGENVVSGSKRINVDEEASDKFLNGDVIDKELDPVTDPEIEAIIYPKLTDGDLSVSYLSPVKGRLKLMEVLDEKLRGDFLLSEQTLPPYSLETDEIRESRKEVLEDLDVDYLFIEGQPEEIYEKVGELI